MNLTILGIWSSRAGDYNPQKHIKTTTEDYRYFYRLQHNATERVKRLTQILIDGKPAGCIHDWLSNDGREDNYFDVPLEFRTPGKHILQFKLYEPESPAADAKAGKLVYESEPFILEFIQ